MTRGTTPRHYRDTPTDVKLVISALWITMLFVVASLLYAVSIVASVIGEEWAYYVIGSVVEVVLLATIAWRAWTWPTVRP